MFLKLLILLYVFFSVCGLRVRVVPGRGSLGEEKVHTAGV